MAATLLVLIAIAFDVTPAWAQEGTTIEVLTDEPRLLTMDIDDTLIGSKPVIGAIAGQTLVGIGTRPQNAMLYAVGVDAATDTVSLYLLSWRTGVATPLGTAPVVGRKFSALARSLPLSTPTAPAAPITVEYVRYQSTTGFLDGGGAALATKVY